MSKQKICWAIRFSQGRSSTRDLQIHLAVNSKPACHRFYTLKVSDRVACVSGEKRRRLVHLTQPLRRKHKAPAHPEAHEEFSVWTYLQAQKRESQPLQAHHHRVTPDALALPTAH